jgi:competence protein ComEA
MPTPAERQALLFFAAIAALGVGVNAWRAVSGQAAPVGSRTDLAAQIARVDSAVASSPSREAKAQKRGQGRTRRGTITLGLPTPPAPKATPSRAARPAPSAAGPAAKVDLDVDSALAIEALPRIGPAMAARIVANRDSFGAFGSIDGLTRVKGIGPAMAKALKDLVVFSGVPRADAPSGAGKGRRRRAMP